MLADANPSVTEFQRDLAGSDSNIGFLLIQTRKPDEALKFFQAALAIGAKLADANPSVTRFQSDLATAYLNLGSALAETGAPADGLNSYRAALAILRSMVQQHPESHDFASQLSVTLHDVALIHMDAMRFAEARDALLQAVELQRRALFPTPLVRHIVNP